MMRVVPLAVDLLFVLVFSIIGRMSHGLDLAGVLNTSWPFLLACVVGWVIVAALGDQGFGFRAFAVIWLLTWLGGLALRITAYGGTDPSFIAVAGAFLFLFLGVWRVVWHLLRRRRSSATE